jgi:ERCC4-type nuclease
MVDSREPESIQEIDFGVTKVVTKLDTGDLWASCSDGETILIERKTPNDLLNSIGDGRAFNQAARMRDQTKWAYVVITGTLTPLHDGHTAINGRATSWKWASVQGALLTIQEFGVNVVFAQHDNHYRDTVEMLARRSRDTDRVLSPVHDTRMMTPGEVMLTALPGIGLSRAQAILEEFDGHPAYALAYLTWMDTMWKVAGIGDGVKAGVRKALKLQDNEEIVVMTPNSHVNDSLQKQAKELEAV